MVKPDKKQLILKAASECFSQNGYEKTSLDEIGRQVGLTKTSVYYYYENKEQIFTEVIHLEIDEFLTNLHITLDNLPNCRGKILSYLSEKVKYMQKLLNLHNLTIESLANVHPFFVELFQYVRKREENFINDILILCQQESHNRDFNTKRVAQNILNILDAMRIGALIGQDYRYPQQINYYKIEDEVIFTVSLILDGLHIDNNENNGND